MELRLFEDSRGSHQATCWAKQMKYSLSLQPVRGKKKQKKNLPHRWKRGLRCHFFLGLFCVTAVRELEEPTKAASNFNLFLDLTHCLVLEGVCILFQLTSRFAFNSGSDSFGLSSCWVTSYAAIFNLFILPNHLWLLWPSHLGFSRFLAAPAGVRTSQRITAEAEPTLIHSFTIMFS